jgi:hypothetical protein
MRSGSEDIKRSMVHHRHLTTDAWRDLRSSFSRWTYSNGLKIREIWVSEILIAAAFGFVGDPTPWFGG